MNKKFRLFVFVFFAFAQNAFAGQCGVYNSQGAATTIMFVNGINNSQPMACQSSNELILKMATNGVAWQKYNWTYFHNQNSGLGSDIVELQLQAIRSNAALDGAGSGQSVEAYYQKLGEIYNSAIFGGNLTEEVDWVTRDLYNKVVEIVETKGQSLVIVPHSQGNFYTEAVYALLKFKGKNNVIQKLRVVGVGVVAATSPSDKYISSEVDNALSTQQLQTHSYAPGAIYLNKYNVLSRTDNPCTGTDSFKKCGQEANLNTGDKWLGHGFVEIYLSGSVYSEVKNKAYSAVIAGMVQDSINELNAVAVVPTISDIAASNGTPTTADAVTFTATASSDNGAITTWSWNFGDNTATSSEQSPTHTFSTAGTYTVTLTVTDAMGKQASKQKTITVSNTSTAVLQLTDSFDGTALYGTNWNAVSGAGGIQYSGTEVTFGGGSYATTQNKKTFSGSKIVLSGRFAGTGQNRDTHMDLVDVTNGDLLSIGDTNYRGYGFYLYGSGASFNGVGSSTAVMLTTGNTVSTFMDYRLTIDGKVVTIERSASLADPTQPIETRNVTMPQSIAGRTFYLRIGTGALVGGYSPGTFDSIAISVTP
jgi:PKD repeat protein